MTSTGQSSAARVMADRFDLKKSLAAGRIWQSSPSGTSKTSGAMSMQRLQEMQPSSIQTFLIIVYSANTVLWLLRHGRRRSCYHVLERKLTVKAVVVHEHGGVEKLIIENRPLPDPGPREVRVRLEAVGLNHLDVWVRRGVPGHEFPLPLITSSDGAGVVDAVGPGVQNVAVGTEVVILPGVSCGICASCQSGQDQLCGKYQILGEARDGCCAEYTVVPDANVAPKPDGLDFPAAASFCLSFQTSWSMLRRARLQPGETILIQGAGSGVGTAAVQIAKLLGATVIATAGSQSKCDAAAELGAEHVIDYSHQDFVDSVRRIRGRSGVDVVFEHVGAKTFEDSVRCLARGGRLVTCGATTGGEVKLSLHRLFFKNLSVIGNTMGSRVDLLRVITLVDQGRLKPIVDSVLKLEDVARAHELLESRDVFGKIVLKP